MLSSINLCYTYTKRSIIAGKICIDKYQIIDTFVANGQLFPNFLFVAVVLFSSHVFFISRGPLKKMLFMTKKNEISSGNMKKKKSFINQRYCWGKGNKINENDMLKVLRYFFFCLKRDSVLG